MLGAILKPSTPPPYICFYKSISFPGNLLFRYPPYPSGLRDLFPRGLGPGSGKSFFRGSGSRKKSCLLSVPATKRGEGVRGVPIRKKNFFLKYGSFSPKIVESFFLSKSVSGYFKTKNTHTHTYTYILTYIYLTY